MIATLLFAAGWGQLANDSRFPEAVQTRALEATVRVFHPATSGEGSGVVIRFENNYAYILTAAHVVPEGGTNADAVEVSFFPKGKPRSEIVPIKTEVKSRMVNEDLAVIRVGLKQAPPAVLPLCPRNEAPPKFFDDPMPVLAVGLGIRGVPEAIVDQVRQFKLVKKPDGSKAFHWEADKPQGLGRSGGPLVDTQGRVIGICSGTRENKGYYVSIYEIEASLKRNAWDFLNR
jgi:S1-C subfamily serine protease